MPQFIVGHFNDCSQVELSDSLIYEEEYVDEFIESANLAINQTRPSNREERITLWFEGIFLTYAHRRYLKLTDNLVRLMSLGHDATALQANEIEIRSCLAEEKCIPELPLGIDVSIEVLALSITQDLRDEDIMKSYIQVIDSSLESCSR